MMVQIIGGYGRRKGLRSRECGMVAEIARGGIMSRQADILDAAVDKLLRPLVREVCKAT